MGIDKADKNGVTSLMHAATTGNIELVGYLLSEGADVEANDSKGLTAADYARNNDHSAVVQLLGEEELAILEARAIARAGDGD